MTIKKGSVVKNKFTGELFKVEHIFHSAGFPDIYACYRLSGYDGMPIGSLINFGPDEIEAQQDKNSCRF